jgi:hypothetical protein
MLRATWRGLETWHGWDAPALPARQPSTLPMSGDGKRGVAEWPKLQAQINYDPAVIDPAAGYIVAAAAN